MNRGWLAEIFKPWVNFYIKRDVLYNKKMGKVTFTLGQLLGGKVSIYNKM